MKFIHAAAVFAATTLAASASVATVSGVSVSQDSAGRVTVGYSIDAPAVITVDFQTNVNGSAYASIGVEHVKTVWGDVNRVVQSGSRTLTWAPRKDWPEQTLPANSLKAVVTETNIAWSSERLHRELRAEHAAMQGRRPGVHRKNARTERFCPGTSGWGYLE